MPGLSRRRWRGFLPGLEDAADEAGDDGDPGNGAEGLMPECFIGHAAIVATGTARLLGTRRPMRPGVFLFAAAVSDCLLRAESFPTIGKSFRNG